MRILAGRGSAADAGGRKLEATQPVVSIPRLPLRWQSGLSPKLDITPLQVALTPRVRSLLVLPSNAPQRHVTRLRRAGDCVEDLVQWARREC